MVRAPTIVHKQRCWMTATSCEHSWSGCCQEFGIDSSQYTFGYVAGWAGNGASNAISSSAQRIVQATRVILDLLEPTAERATEGAA
jgi:hypothetical protein